MRRPLASKRPIGPFKQIDRVLDRDLRTNNLANNEIRVTLGKLSDDVEDEAEVLEMVISGDFDDTNEPPLREKEETFVDEQLLSGAKRTRRSVDLAARKLAEQHKAEAGHYPNVWDEYKENARRRDEAIEEMEEILS